MGPYPRTRFGVGMTSGYLRGAACLKCLRWLHMDFFVSFSVVKSLALRVRSMYQPNITESNLSISLQAHSTSLTTAEHIHEDLSPHFFILIT